MSDLTVLEVVGSEPEALLVCAILRDAGVQCMHRITNLGSGAMDGLTMGGPREIVVHRDQVSLAQRVLDEQRDGPRPTPDAGGDDDDDAPAPELAAAVATSSLDPSGPGRAGPTLARR
jgi:hypothetical protein